jgi:hypothetical protein
MEVENQPVDEVRVASAKAPVAKSIGKVPSVKSSGVPKAPSAKVLSAKAPSVKSVGKVPSAQLIGEPKATGTPKAPSAKATGTPKVPSAKATSAQLIGEPKATGTPKAPSAKATGTPKAPSAKVPSVKSTGTPKSPSAKARSVKIRDSALKEAIGQIHAKKNARKTLKKIIEKTGLKKLAIKIRSKFLQSICSDSGVCIAFDNERKKIFDFFNGFSKFDYVQNVRSIGAVSANGFVKEIEYEREGYKAHAILKSSRTKDADNLMYEYFVGYILNKAYLNKTPSFVESYGCYKYKSIDEWTKIQTVKSGPLDLNSMLIPYAQGVIDVGEACKYSKTICILIQHIKGASSIADKVYKGTPDFDYIKNDLFYSIYQIYYTLAFFQSNFTHYDLHGDNVILYKPVTGKYIHFHYHMKDGTIIDFKNQYIAKMIDYGRSYINYKPADLDSSQEYDFVCKAKVCNTGYEHCGDESGYSWLEPPIKEVNHYISSSLSNRSHDLRLLHILWNYMPWKQFEDSKTREALKQVLGRVKYSKSGTGTPPVVGVQGNDIEDVNDAEHWIRKMMTSEDMKASNEAFYSGMDKLGDLHIYGNKPMKFTPAQ